MRFRTYMTERLRPRTAAIAAIGAAAATLASLADAGPLDAVVTPVPVAAAPEAPMRPVQRPLLEAALTEAVTARGAETVALRIDALNAAVASIRPVPRGPRLALVGPRPVQRPPVDG